MFHTEKTKDRQAQKKLEGESVPEKVVKGQHQLQAFLCRRHSTYRKSHRLSRHDGIILLLLCIDDSVDRHKNKPYKNSSIYSVAYIFIHLLIWSSCQWRVSRKTRIFSTCNFFPRSSVLQLCIFYSSRLFMSLLPPKNCISLTTVKEKDCRKVKLVCNGATLYNFFVKN